MLHLNNARQTSYICQLLDSRRETTMAPSLTCMLKLFKYEAFQTVVDIKIPGHPHFGYKPNIDFVSGVILLLNKLLCLHLNSKHNGTHSH